MRRNAEFRIYAGECEAYGVNTSYLVWQPIWRGLSRNRPGVASEAPGREAREARGRGRPDPGRRVPLLGSLLGLPLPDNELTQSFDPKLRKTSLESLLAQCLRGIVGDEPTLLVLEECHWLDPLSHDLLDVMARAVADLPVLILLAYRPLRLARPRRNRPAPCRSQRDLSGGAGAGGDG